MKAALKKRCIAAISLLAGVCLWMAAVERLHAGPPTFVGTQGELVPPDPSNASPEAFESGAPAAIGDRCSPNYWIISTRSCRQKSRPNCPYCCFNFFHRTPDGCLRRSDGQAFQESLVPGVPACVMIHGSFVSWDDVLTDSEKTFAWIRDAAPQLPLHVVFFTWPSEGFVTGVPHIDVAILGERSAWNGVYLAQLILQLENDHPISIVGHSHGARTAVAALHLLGGGTVQGTTVYGASPPQRRIRAVLAAAAIDHDWLNPGKLYGNALCPVECLVNLRNRHDVPLFFYPLRKPFSKRALARSGFTSWDRRHQGWLGAKTSELDITEFAETGHMWPNYYRHPEIACALVPWIYFNEAPVEQYQPSSIPEVSPH